MPAIDQSGVMNIISGIDNLPTPPVVFSRINEAIANPNASAYQIAAIISEDPAMSAKILRLSNSAFYGCRAEITSVKQAIITVGLEAIRSLVLSTSVLSAFKGQAYLAKFQEDFWRHSLSVATACKVLTRKLSSEWIQKVDKGFSAGLLHDIGKLVMVAYLPDEWNKVQEALKDSKQPAFMTEKNVLGYSHSEIGAALASRWNLPEFIQDALAFHHFPHSSPMEGSLAPLVYAGNLLTHITFEKDAEDLCEEDIDSMDQAVLGLLKTDMEPFFGLRPILIDEYAKSEVFLQIARDL
jgi:putative nucleotidyltransferase with HDIG domain